VRKREFALPNFVATVQFPAATGDVEIIVYGADGPTVENRLKSRYPGILVKRVDPYDFEQKWRRKATARKDAVMTAIAAGEKYDFSKNSIWGDLKDYLFDLFDENCAYCECSLKAGSFGAVEHYRPKSPVVGVPGHPGYYWLAFEVHNYLPTCTQCNTAKSNRFPLADGSPRATAEGEEALEHPLLLNPFSLVKATDHLRFVNPKIDAKVGPMAKGVTDEGKESVELLRLNRPDLMTDRLLEQERAVVDYFATRRLGIRPNPVIQQLAAGKRPFSAAALAAVESLEQGFPSLGD